MVVLAVRPEGGASPAPASLNTYETSVAAETSQTSRTEELVFRSGGSAASTGARVETVAFDADDVSSHRGVVEGIEDRFGPIGTAVLAFGILGDQALAERDEAEVARILHTDFVAQASLLTVLADRMRARPTGERGRGHGDARVSGRTTERSGPGRRGRIVAFSSVAGVRVRRANYVYGSAKAGLDGFASGLADALHGSGVDLVIARPGFVIGRMTRGMKPAIFSSTPEQVADAVVARLRSGGPAVLWIPWQLRALFAVARVVPAPVWRRMPR